MSTNLQKKDILFCSACAKPLAGEYYTIKHKMHGKESWHYHNSYEECAEAPAIRKDWKRIVKQGQTKTHNGTQARLQEGDGYSWDTNNSMPMR